MTMPVTDDQVAALRAYLSGDLDLHKQLYGRLDRAAARTGYTALVAAAFFEAADRRFARNGTAADVIEFVGDVRGRSERLAEEIDPSAAERMIRAVLTDEDISDMDDEVKGRLYIVLLAALIFDEQLDGAGLDAFLVDARKLADQWIG
jgi:hypothetical protein